MIYLGADDLLHIGRRVLGAEPLVGDEGLLHSAAERPEAAPFGTEAYPTLELKAAALVHSVIANHALVDGNKRLGLGALLAFLGINGRRLRWTNDEAYAFIMRIAADEVRDVAAIADEIAAGMDG
jgi:death-on-curing protein